MGSRRPLRTCDIAGCDAPVRRGILMCRPHWFATPAHLRTAINQTWRDQSFKAWIANRAEAQRWHREHPLDRTPPPPRFAAIDLSHPETHRP